MKTREDIEKEDDDVINAFIMLCELEFAHEPRLNEKGECTRCKAIDSTNRLVLRVLAERQGIVAAQGIRDEVEKRVAEAMAESGFEPDPHNHEKEKPYAV